MSVSDLAPFFFPPRKLIHPPWGGTRLSSLGWCGEVGERIGESWEFQGNTELTLLIKFLDIGGVLSVQVHPNDAQARALDGQPNGKAEAWVVLAASPDACVAWGLQRDLSVDELRDRAQSGEIEKDLRWVPVQAGDIVDLPPGTIHTTRGEILIYEVQQVSDLTYRLYDWGRPRPLHLDKAALVARRCAETALPRRVGVGRVIENSHFVVDRLVVSGAGAGEGLCEAWTVVSGEVVVNGARVVAGATVVVGAGRRFFEGEGEVLVAGVR